MIWRRFGSVSSCVASALSAGWASSAASQPLVHTYSILARDPKLATWGVAVQWHWFSVGLIVTWAEAGVGLVATQSFVDPGYGPRGLELMRQGMSAPDALTQLVAADANRDGRQVAMVNARGGVDAYTGKNAIAAAGHVVGTGASAQANMIGQATVWPAMPPPTRRRRAIWPIA